MYTQVFCIPVSRASNSRGSPTNLFVTVHYVVILRPRKGMFPCCVTCRFQNFFVVA